MTSLLDAPPEKNDAARYVAVLGTLAAHGAIVLFASLFGARAISEVRKFLPVTEMIEVDVAPPPAPSPPDKAPPEPTPVRATAHQPAPTPSPPAAAQAGQVLAAKADVVDFGDTMVVGTGDAYAGGVTDSKGTSKTAVHDTQASGAAVTETRTPAAPAVDLSRPPQLAGGARWDCPFPLEADDAGLDHAVVTLRIDVGADGQVQRVNLITDPGNGFGREARRCAGSKRWQAALDRVGHPLAAAATVNVRFDR